MPFVIVRYDNKYRFFTLEAPVMLVRKLAKDLSSVNFQMKLGNETRITGDLARTGVSLRDVLDAIEMAGWELFQASTGGHAAGSMGNELYIFKAKNKQQEHDQDHAKTTTTEAAKTETETDTKTLMLPPPPPRAPKAGVGDNRTTGSSSSGTNSTGTQVRHNSNNNNLLGDNDGTSEDAGRSTSSMHSSSRSYTSKSSGNADAHPNKRPRRA
eukprot:CAMPEP_0197536862 /NCGR_PEP_ID=MMETSP1318-20131121/55107_1 /TAXON_ID=552666 /ORGANISM="Partenskyella glossopodia, Strain RCC365" /LENGTH=211 /DNA_ID=CAMNT_0043094873 /DNA_START=18 /DNA_END=653 /DNA_ORIENTATION=-